MNPTLADVLIATARATVESGLNHGASGNVSARTPDGLLITPSGAHCDRLQPSNLISLDASGRVLGGEGEPSSEWRMHQAVYAARPDVHAVVHAHPPYATAIACLRRDLPAVHYYLASAGAAVVRCSAYACFGTAELSTAALDALGFAKACLLANHGLLAVGTDLGDALRVAEDVEEVAALFWRASAIGPPVSLTATEVDEAIQRLGAYGKRGVP